MGRTAVVITTKRGSKNGIDNALYVVRLLEEQGFNASIEELSLKNPPCGYYDSFPHVRIDALKCADVVAVLGGDGSKNYIANLLIHFSIKAKLIGISGGSHNAGKLSNASLYDVADLECFHLKRLSAIRICVDDEVYYAFHDVIFSSTFVTMYNKKRSQLSARTIMDGVRKLEDPQYIGDSKTKIQINRQNGGSSVMPVFDPVGIISSAELDRYQKYMVMCGAANHPINIGANAGIIVSGERLVWPNRSLEEYSKAEPIITAFASYSGEDYIQIEGLNKNAYLIIDGNAVCPVGGRQVVLSHCRKAISAFVPDIETDR